MKRIWSILAICLLFTICITIIPTVTLAQHGPQSTDPFIFVDWQRNQFFDTSTWDSTNTEWLFGETLQLIITYENDTDIAVNEYQADRGDLMKFTLIVPKAFFEQGNTELEMATIGLDMYNETHSAGIWMDYFTKTGDWNVFSALHDMMPSDPRDPVEFFDFQGGFITEDTTMLNITFTGVFNSFAPIGVYHSYAHAMDDANNFIYPSWFNLGYTGDMPMPPIALECELDFHHGFMPMPEYELRLLNGTSLMPIQYAEAGDPLIVELTMTEPVGFAGFSLDWIIDGGWQPEYVIRMNVSYPEDYSDFNTAWYEYEAWLYPSLGFSYNATTDVAEAFAFYKYESYVWEDYGSGMGNWMYQPEMVVNASILPDFIVFDPSSGDLDPQTIHWKFSLTEAVLNHGNDNYGGFFHVWAGQPREHGTSTLDGKRAEPSMSFCETDGFRFGYNDFLADGFIRDAFTGEIRTQADPLEHVNISLDVHASSELFEHFSDPDNSAGQWEREELTLETITLWIGGNAWGWNDTHNWNAYSSINLLIDADTLTVIDQYCSIVNETWFSMDGFLVSRVETNTTVGLSNLIQVFGVEIDIAEQLTKFNVEMKFLNGAPHGDYWFEFQAQQNRTIYWNTTGTWEPQWWNIEFLYFGGRTQWTPSWFTLGNTWSYIPELWAVTEDGALDLDGDLETIADQYYVKRVYNWHDDHEWTDDSLFVHITFDPTPMFEHQGDEFMSSSWMGLHTDRVTYQWNESFYWYHSNDLSLVSAPEMASILDTVWLNMTEQIPAPGYHGIAWMTLNRSWDDIQAEWWWLDDNTWEFSWFGFDTTQGFVLAFDDNSTTHANFHTAFSGLLLFTDNQTLGGNGVPDFYVTEGFIDTDEVTHYFLMEDVGSISFTLPFNSTESDGQRQISTSEWVDYGVRIYDITGTLFPTHTELGTGLKSCWDYHGTGAGLVGLNATDFDYMVSQATIDEIGFDVHFQVLLANTAENPEPNNNLVDIKVDQYIGDWTLHHFDNRVLEGRGLAISYFGALSTDTFSEFSVDNKQVASNNENTEIGDMYLFGSEGRTFASVQMGGQLYDWGKDGQTYNCSAATVPMGAFSAMFHSETGKSVTHWEMESTFFFMLSGFTNWDGYSIDNDPYFGIYTSALNMIPPGPPPGDGLDWLLQNVGIIAIGVAILVILVVVGIMNVRRRGSGPSKATRKATSDYWADR